MPNFKMRKIRLENPVAHIKNIYYTSLPACNIIQITNMFPENQYGKQ